jgi:hypothetical protein
VPVPLFGKKEPVPAPLPLCLFFYYCLFSSQSHTSLADRLHFEYSAAFLDSVKGDMVMAAFKQQISYIAPAAPARRRQADGNEPFLRPEMGFTPNWFRSALGIDFGRKWHTDPAYRRETVVSMREELRRRFPGTAIGRIDRPDRPLDLLTGTYGGSFVAGIFGIPIIYADDNWPNCEHKYLEDDEADALETPDLDNNEIFQDLVRQMDWIQNSEGSIEGFINWQGILNTAQRLRGEKIFFDMMDNPDRCRRLFDCIFETMTEGIKRLHDRQRASGAKVDFITVSNCLVNMVSPQQYRRLLMPYDIKIQQVYDTIAIHNCAWNATPYFEPYSEIPNIGYLDMGIDSDMARARDMFPDTRRALMYTPMDLENKSTDEITSDIEKIAREFAPCDVVVADIDAGTPDKRILWFLELCDKINQRKENFQS